MDGVVTITNKGGHIDAQADSLAQVKVLCSLAFVEACLREGLGDDEILGHTFAVITSVRKLRREDRVK